MDSDPSAFPLSLASRRMAAVMIFSLLGVMFGGAVLTYRLVALPAYGASPLHQDLWRAGHAHAALFLVLTLVCLPWIDAARLSEPLRWVLRVLISSASVTFPAAFFFAAPSPATVEATPVLWLLVPGAILFASGLLLLVWGLLRRTPQTSPTHR